MPANSEAALPRVTVLLATHNGEAFLREQLDSILNQTGVDLRLIVSDDNSVDATLDILREFASRDSRVTLLEQGVYGSPGANFYRLLTEADFGDADFIGFSDQDDVWLPGKLERHARLAREHGADGISSNLIAFSEDGTRRLLRKDFPQRKADFLFETPGAGSTMLLTNRLAALVREQLLNPESPAKNAWSHDLLFYALGRSAGLKWFIDPEPSVEYRQHAGNAIGANTSARDALKRLKLTASRWHRNQVRTVAEACIHVATPEELPRLQWFYEMLRAPTPTNMLRLARRASELRRKRRDQVVLAALIVLGLW